MRCANGFIEKQNLRETNNIVTEKKTSTPKYLQVWQPKVTIQEFDATTGQDHQPCSQAGGVSSQPVSILSIGRITSSILLTPPPRSRKRKYFAGHHPRPAGGQKSSFRIIEITPTEPTARYSPENPAAKAIPPGKG